MVGLLRSVLTERGLDPRDFTLLAFGGAGPLHAGELLRAFEISEAMVPIYPAEFSAFGFILTDARVDRHRTVQLTSERFDYLRASRSCGNWLKRDFRSPLTGIWERRRYHVRWKRDTSVRTMSSSFLFQPTPFVPDSSAALWEAFHEYMIDVSVSA